MAAMLNSVARDRSRSPARAAPAQPSNGLATEPVEAKPALGLLGALALEPASPPAQGLLTAAPHTGPGVRSLSSESAVVLAAAPPVLSYQQANPTGWTAKQVGKSAMGSPTICIYDEKTHTAPIFCLYETDECGTLVFPLEPRKEGEVPSFISGAAPNKKVESLDLITTLVGNQVKFAQSIDEWCKQQALANCRDWFGRTCSQTEIDVMYSSPVKIDESGKYAPNLRAKMNLGGIDRFLTRVTFVRTTGIAEEGAGWEFVEPRLGEQKWRQHRARMVLEARRIWIVGRKFGLTYSITNLAVREKTEARPNPFASDSTVEHLAAFS